jgi:hypothetical protein
LKKIVSIFTSDTFKVGFNAKVIDDIRFRDKAARSGLESSKVKNNRKVNSETFREINRTEKSQAHGQGCQIFPGT